jgi:hypothetical protein
VEERSDPFALFDQLTAARAAIDSGERTSDTGVGPDRHQITRMEKLRAKAQAEGNRLRARPRNRSRPNRARPVRGYMEDPGAA